MPDEYLNILATHTALPGIRHSAEDIENAFDRWLEAQDRAVQVKAKRVLRNSGIDGRHSFLTIDEIFTPCGLTESSRRYREHSISEGTSALETTLVRAGVLAHEVDVLITTSCTGYMIPSVDAYLAENLGMRSNVIRLPVTEMGCAAGASAMIYAAEMLRGHPGRTAAIVNIEFPTNTMQHSDVTMDNIIATALFSDGIACTVLRNEPTPGRARIIDWAMHQVAGTTELLGYQLTDTGLRMNLDASLPEVIGEHFEESLLPLLSRHGMTLADVRHFVIHPGGLKIIERIESVLGVYGGDAKFTRQVMARYGNMSSSTVIFILDALLASNPAAGPGLLLSFGPGFGSHQVLLEIGGA